MPQGILVLLNVFVESQELESVTKSLERLPQITDLYEVTGEYDLVAVISTESINTFRDLLKNRILRIKGIRSTVSAVIIHTHKREGKSVAD